MLQKLLFTLSITMFAFGVSAQSRLLMTATSDANLRIADTATLSISSTNSMSISGGGTINGSNGLAVHPCTGEIYAVAQVGSSFGRSIITTDTNGNANNIGNTNDLVASIAFDDQGTLYAVTGDGATNSETLYTVDLTDGSLTTVTALGNGSDGEAIAYCPDNGYMYHWSGWESSLASLTFERINLNTNAVTNVGMTGTASLTSVRAATYLGEGVFLISVHSNDGLYLVDTSGAVTYTGVTTSFNCKGLALDSENPIAISSSASGLCPGEDATLTSTPGTSYQWYLNGAAISGATSQTYTTTIGGQYNCIVATANCTDSSTVGFFLDSLNAPLVELSSNDSGFCPGNQVTISGSAGGQSQWFFNGDTIPGATGTSILVAQEGWYNMVKTNMNGCSDSASVGIFLEEFDAPDVDLGADDGFCAGDTFSIDAGSFPGGTYFWTPFANTQVNNVTDSGTYSVIVQNAQGCQGSDTIHLQLFPDATLDLGDDTTICQDESITIDAGDGYASYSWSGGQTTQQVTVGQTSTPESLICTVSNVFGCEATDTITIFREICTGIGTISAGAFELFPNPSNGMLNIQGSSLLAKVIIMDAQGRMVNEVNPLSNAIQLSLQTGFYLIKISDANGASETHRVIIR